MLLLVTEERVLENTREIVEIQAANKLYLIAPPQNSAFWYYRIQIHIQMQKYKILEMQLAAQTNTQLLHLKVPPAGRSGRKSEDIWFHSLNTLSTQH